MFTLLEWFDLRRNKFFVYPALSSVLFDVREFVHRNGVFLVQRCSVKLLGGGDCLLRS